MKVALYSIQKRKESCLTVVDGPRGRPIPPTNSNLHSIVFTYNRRTGA